jgi:hypothetical protein
LNQQKAIKKFVLAILSMTLAAIASTTSVASPPVEFPHLDVVDDVNPCTGQAITLTFASTVRVTEFDDHFVAHYSGTVTTTDGGSGHYRIQQVSNGDGHVTTQHNHDMEGYDNHQRVIFALILHTTVVDGEVKSHPAGDALRAHLPRQSQDQLQHRVCRAVGGHPRR